MAGRWAEALRRGKSGLSTTAGAAPTAFKLKLGVNNIEEIPEYTEEEERADLAAGPCLTVSMIRAIADSRSVAPLPPGAHDAGYMSTAEVLGTNVSGRQKDRGDRGTSLTTSGTQKEDEGLYLEFIGTGGHRNDAYLGIDDLNEVLMNDKGQYLTLDSARKVIRDAGYMGLNDVGGFVPISEVPSLVGRVAEKKKAAGDGAWPPSSSLHPAE